MGSSRYEQLSVRRFDTPFTGPGRALTAATTLTDNDDFVTATVAGGSFTITLPSAVGRLGQTIWVKRTDSGANVLTVTAAAGNVEGVTSVTLGPLVGNAFRSDGTDWWRFP